MNIYKEFRSENISFIFVVMYYFLQLNNTKENGETEKCIGELMFCWASLNYSRPRAIFDYSINRDVLLFPASVDRAIIRIPV